MQHDQQYTPESFENHIQSQWESNTVYSTPSNQEGSQHKPKKYILDAFAYPSGTGLHAGHAKGYIATDIVARFYRMNGYDVLFPIGWDAFGLPAENYAIKTGVHPRTNTDKTISYYQKQVRSLGLSNDWNDEITSHKEEYYKWTQWFFGLLYKKGLAYKKEALVNWDPVDKTVLANEQVLSDGTSERSGAKVEQKLMSQWFFKITEYAERLLADLDEVSWPESTKQMQKNWIGKSEGAMVTWDIVSDIPDFVYGDGDKNNCGEVRKRGVAVIRIKETGEYVCYKKTSDPTFVYFAGGLIEEGENGYESAIRETKEEIGIDNLEFVSKIGVCNNYVPYKESTTHYCEEYYLFEVSLKDYQSRTKAEVDNEGASVYGEVVLVTKDQILKNQWPQLKWVFDRIDSSLPQQITVFTTRIDTIYSGSFLILAPEHPLVDVLTTPENAVKIEEYREKTKHKTQFDRTEINKEKTGVFTGSYAINPATGEEVQVWIADFVLGNYGTGAVFGDAHDERDFEFAKHYGIPLKTCIKPPNREDDEDIVTLKECYGGYGILYNSGQFDGLTSEEAKTKITEYGQKKGWAKPKTTYKLRDWLVSRQRYWGSPIPIVYDKEGQEKYVGDENLPVVLPDEVEFSPTGRSPLYDHSGFHNSAEELFGEGVRREVDTMDTFVCSSWYMFRFCNPHNKAEFASVDSLKKWLSVDEYCIGTEHTVLHLLYARFFTKVLYDEGIIDVKEPFISLRHPGMIQGSDGRKMSKRWGNVVNPIDVIEEYGADTLRMYEMFMGPFDQPNNWNTSAIKGQRRFLERVWRLQYEVKEDIPSESKTKVEIELSKLIKKISNDIPQFSFNTAIAELMKFLNVVEQVGSITTDQWRRFLLVLAPFAPFVTEKLYLGSKEITQESSIHTQRWPTYDESLLQNEGVLLGIQVNGKVRSEIFVSSGESEGEVYTRVLQDPKITKWLEGGKEVKKFIYIPNKIVNVVIG